MSFNSNLPIILIKVSKGDQINSGGYEKGFMVILEPGSEKTTKAKRTFLKNRSTDGVRIGIKRRGSSTVGYPKASFAIETRNEDSKDQAIAPFGWPKSSDWILGASYEVDRSLIRDALIYRLSNEIGEYAPRIRQVELFLNTDGSPFSYTKHYMGVYSFTEKIKRGKQRVKVRSWKGNGAGNEKDGGFIFKKDWPDVGRKKIGFEVFGLGKLNWVYPREKLVSPEQKKYLSGELEDFALAMKSFGGIHPISKKHFTELIDTRSWLVWHWLNLLAKNLDAYKASAYFYRRSDSRGGLIGAGPVWDFDRSMNSSDPRDDNPTGWEMNQGADQSFKNRACPIWGDLLGDPCFRQMHIDLWQELRRKELSWKNIELIIDELSSELQSENFDDFEGANPTNLKWPRSPVVRNYTRWKEVSPRGGSHATEVEILKRFLKARLRWIDAQYSPVPEFSTPSGWFKSGLDVSLPGEPKGLVYYTTDGSDPRTPEGKQSPKAQLLKRDDVIEIKASTVVIARNQIGRGVDSWSGPVRYVYLIGSRFDSAKLKLTAIEAKPAGPKDEKEKTASEEPADFEYLELTNTSEDQVLDLTGCKMIKGIQFSFDQSAITSLEPGQNLYLVRNAEAFTARYGEERVKRVAGSYGPSKLDNKGEKILLIDGAGRVLLEQSIESREVKTEK